MKYLSILLIVFFPSLCFSQTDTAMKYTDVVVIPGASKDLLFQKAWNWINENFKSDKDVIQIQDKESGELAAKGIMVVPATFHSMGKRTYNYDINFNLSIIVKEGKYKYVFDGFKEETFKWFFTSSAVAPETPHSYKKQRDECWNSLKENINIQIISLITTLKKSMAEKSNTDF